MALSKRSVPGNAEQFPHFDNTKSHILTITLYIIINRSFDKIFT